MRSIVGGIFVSAIVMIAFALPAQSFELMILHSEKEPGASTPLYKVKELHRDIASWYDIFRKDKILLPAAVYDEFEGTMRPGIRYDGMFLPTDTSSRVIVAFNNYEVVPSYVRFQESYVRDGNVSYSIEEVLFESFDGPLFDEHGEKLDTFSRNNVHFEIVWSGYCSLTARGKGNAISTRVGNIFRESMRTDTPIRMNGYLVAQSVEHWRGGEVATKSVDIRGFKIHVCPTKIDEVKIYKSSWEALLNK